MIDTLTIKNFKSVADLSLPLGRVNVFIGENGAGKSNILEAIALAAAAEAEKLDNEFLASRGIRVSSDRLMRSAFDRDTAKRPIIVSIDTKDGSSYEYELNNDGKPYSSWEASVAVSKKGSPGEFPKFLRSLLANLPKESDRMEVLEQVKRQIEDQISTTSEHDDNVGQSISGTLQFTFSSTTKVYDGKELGSLADFLIYSPENSVLQAYESEGQIQPLGINGEGLIRFLQFSQREKDKVVIDEVVQTLELFDWFSELRPSLRKSKRGMTIIDRFLHEGAEELDQRSANEGFMFTAFYAALLSSKLTPGFFAIDNVDTALNPKLCREMVRKISFLAKKHEKQVILTTHNPAVLDGIDLNDDQQRLFIISRNSKGHTRARRFKRKSEASVPLRLSQLFIDGALGGLPKSF